MKNPFKVGDLVKLRPDVLGRHAKRVPAHAGFTTVEFQWRETLNRLADKKGKITRISPDSKFVTVEYEQPWESKDEHGRSYRVNSIGIDFTELVPYTQEPAVAEGVGYVYDKDMKKDPKHIKGKRWTVKYESEKDLDEKSSVNEGTIREVIQELIKETRETLDKNYIIFGKSGPVTSYYCESQLQPGRMVQFGRDMAKRFQTLQQVQHKIIQLKQKYKGITHWDYEIVQNPFTSAVPFTTPPRSPNRKGHTVSKPVYKRDSEEWFVRYAIDGKTDEGKSYYTTDKDDALATYAYMTKTAAEENKKLGIQ